ncbi:hypothetical protein [Evansella tamaricis]|uniref:Uncharacterized protein n=1 Tax=Evansella tamaricis TaxID=2069301 RepID=A0ABS6JG18_9BACI|nr:hypothetical protein [Evansella tamaricis]MBU9712637.1 hypothetical protein [Evansella tamaricis]
MGDENKREVDIVQIDEIRKEINDIETDLKSKLNENDVKVMLDEYAKLKKVVTEEEVIVIVDRMLNEKKYMTESDVNTTIKEVHLTLIKWVLGTAISSVALIVAILRLLF